MAQRLVIVGGVAAGASAAAKARRTDENIEIVLLEAGPYISFANCGLPYYVGGEIADRDDLFVVTAERFARRFRVDVRTQTEATGVDSQRKTVTLRGADGSAEELSYDRLVLATGASGITPPIPGLDTENVFTLRTVPDADAVVEHLHRFLVHNGENIAVTAADGAAPRAVVIGGGYIGLETAEQLRHRGLRVTIIEMLPQLMTTLDAEMAEPIREAMERTGCEVILGDALAEVRQRDGVSVAVTQSGREVPFELGLVAIGVRPNVELAKQAGVTIGSTGAVQVDERQRTSDGSVYAAGDNCETTHAVLRRPVNIPLAGPANKAGRVAGANAALDLAGASEDDPRRLRMAPVLGSAIVRAGNATAAATGITETQAVQEGIKHEVLYMPGASHAGYYPGAERMLIKLLYNPATGRLLGAQAVGGEGVDKRIDVLATAILAGMTVEDLEALDLCYAPQYGSGKDVVILAGFAAANARRGVMPSLTPQQLVEMCRGDDPPVLVDVRSRREWERNHLDDAVHIPVDELRERMDELPADRPVALHCASGYRSYVAQRILLNAGRERVYNVLGTYGLLRKVHDADRQPQT
jgi:NADPH-dependent 2,4-dienoyl-CoA reductase/sulfur reductase-like enzyme/rhodanese-related sulfurtransferase